jgi:septal ring-binding cell division protein DamX
MGTDTERDRGERTMGAAEDEKNQDQPLEGEDLLSGIDLGGEAVEPEADSAPETEDSSEQIESPELETEAETMESDTEASSESSTPAPEEDTHIVEISELKKLDEEAASEIYVSTLNTLPPGFKLLKTLGLVQTAILLQARRIQELRLQTGMQDVIHQLKEEAASTEGNAIVGIQISVTPLGQLYPDSVWITAMGTCAVIERRKPTKKKTKASTPSDNDDVDPIPT